MNQKKHTIKKYTVNERIATLEKMCYKLALEVNAIVAAINMTVKEKDNPE
tara:strand:- start:558 stop:707 length:150 start_codon:yes stop_codon:yes gene_type:complete